MVGGGGLGGDSYTDVGTGRAGPQHSSADGGPNATPPQVGGVGSVAVLVVAVILVLAFLGAVLRIA